MGEPRAPLLHEAALWLLAQGSSRACLGWALSWPHPPLPPCPVQAAGFRWGPAEGLLEVLLKTSRCLVSSLPSASAEVPPEPSARDLPSQVFMSGYVSMTSH